MAGAEPKGQRAAALLRPPRWPSWPDRAGAARAVSRYAAASAAGNLLWEAFQLPLYTLWRTASPFYLAFATLHCWLGDLVIAAVSLRLAIVIAGRAWPSHGYARVAAAALCFGFAYMVFSEWLNVAVRASWTYKAVMPRLPPLGTGLSPLLQWIVVPLIAFAWAYPRFRQIGSRSR